MNASPNSKPTRAFTPGRVVALMLLGAVVAGLAYLGVGGYSGSVSVPKGARAGQLTLHPSHYGTADGSYAADCGTLVVAENRHKADSRLIALPVTRIRALSSHPSEPIFRLEGGPGISNTHFTNASRFASKHDVVLVGYRGVDGSSKLDCPEVASARKRAAAPVIVAASRTPSSSAGRCYETPRLSQYALPRRAASTQACQSGYS
jgi:hypothetical protein